MITRKGQKYMDKQRNSSFNANLMNCPACGNTVSRRAATCPACGEKISSGKCRNAKLGFIILGFTAICVIIAAIIGSDNADLAGFPKKIFTFCILEMIVGCVAMAICFTSPSK